MREEGERKEREEMECISTGYKIQTKHTGLRMLYCRLFLFHIK